uniref:DUF6598 domain-containing protein n=1 Tax=Oryza nivara TaxID=4536 RepID=A0A0E0FNY4_ORYNI
MASWEDEPSGGSREPSEPSGCTDLIMPPLRPESPPELLDRLLLHDEEEETTSYVASAHPAPIEYGSDDDAGLTRFVDDMYSCVELDDVVDKETVCPGQKPAPHQLAPPARSMRGLFRAGKHPSSVPAHVTTHPSSSSCSLRQCSSSFKFRGAARHAHAKAKHTEAYKEFVASGYDYAQLLRYPLRLFPKTSYHCIKKSIYCDHHEYLTFTTSETASTIGMNEPNDMLQIFSLKLSSNESYPISVYGIFAVRDELDRLRNYVFNRTRDNPVLIEQDSITLPLCSPCRGMYILSYALFEVDLWVKAESEGGGSDDKQLLSEYAEIENRGLKDPMIYGRIPSDRCLLDVDCMFLLNSVEAVIQVFTKDDSDNPHRVRFTAFSSGFDHEIVLYDDRLCKKGKLFQNVVAVKYKEKLVIRLEFEGSTFRWTFQDGAVAAVSSPDDSVSKLFDVVVQIIQQETKDKLCWKFTNNGICSTKSAYKEVYKREISNAHQGKIKEPTQVCMEAKAMIKTYTNFLSNDLMQEDLDEEDTNRRMSHNHNGSITFEGELLAFQLAMEIARFLKFTFSQIVPSSRGHLQEKKLSRRTRALELKANLEPNLYEKVNWIPRELNKLADKLAKEAKSQLCLNPTYSCQNISHIALSQQEMLC